MPVRMACTTLLLSHMDAPDWPSLATQLCCRMFAQRCRSPTQGVQSRVLLDMCGRGKGVQLQLCPCNPVGTYH